MRRLIAAALGLACLLAGCGADHTPIGGTPCRVSDTDPRRWDLTGRMFAETDEAYLFYDGAIEDDALRDALWGCIAAAETVPVDALFILQLIKDGSYKLIELPIDDELPRACLALHEALKPVKRKKKGEPKNG